MIKATLEQIRAVAEQMLNPILRDNTKDMAELHKKVEEAISYIDNKEKQWIHRIDSLGESAWAKSLIQDVAVVKRQSMLAKKKMDQNQSSIQSTSAHALKTGNDTRNVVHKGLMKSEQQIEDLRAELLQRGVIIGTLKEDIKQLQRNVSVLGAAMTEMEKHRGE